MLNEAIPKTLPLLSNKRTIVFDAYVSHPPLGDDTSLSIVAVCYLVF